MNLEPDGKRNCEIEERQIDVDVLNDFGFNWKLPTEFEPDWTQLQYQNMYKSPDYVASKFPNGFSNLIGFDQIIRNIANKIRTPLEEITYCYNIIDEERNNSNISEFEDCQ